MTDEWIVDGLPIAGDWTGTGPCAPAGNANSIVDNVTITGSPGAITSVQNDKSLWALVLNDGTPQADFRLDRFDDAGAIASSPMTIVRATGVVSFHDPVMLPADPVADLEAATKHYVDANAAGLTDAPDDGSFYGRKSLTWANPSHSDITDWAASLAPYALISSVPIASTTTPLMDGTAAAGSAGSFARADHVHPTDTSRYAASNPSGYQTAAQVTASLAPYALTASVPVASSTTPAMDGTAAAGTGTTWARADHVHPSDTSRYAASNPSGYQTAAQVTAALAPYAPLAGATFTGAVAANAGISATTVTASGVITCNAGNVQSTLSGSGNPQFTLTNAAGPRGAVFWDNASGTIRMRQTPSSGDASMDGAGNFAVTGQAFKPSGGSWSATSDARIKTVEGDYTAGLEAVLKLRAVRYVYKGNDTPGAETADALDPARTSAAPPYPASPHYQAAKNATPFVGFVAQELETVFPSMVSSSEGFIDGEKVTDLRNVNTGELIYALVNSVKTLAARVAELEAR